MDSKPTFQMPEEIHQNSNIQDVQNDTSVRVDIYVVPQMTQVTLNDYNQPSISAISDRGPPPSYDEVIDPNAPPPSYESLYSRIQMAHKSRKDIFDFLKSVLIILLGTIGLMVVFGFSIIFSICKVIIGGYYLYDCPQQECIPIYLLVAGSFELLIQLSSRPTEDNARKSSTCEIKCFLVLWLIFGSICIYKEYEPNYDPALGTYCNKNLYLFAFWSVTICHIATGITLLSACIISIFKISSIPNN